MLADMQTTTAVLVANILCEWNAFPLIASFMFNFLKVKKLNKLTLMIQFSM